MPPCEMLRWMVRRRSSRRPRRRDLLAADQPRAHRPRQPLGERVRLGDLVRVDDVADVGVAPASRRARRLRAGRGLRRRVAVGIALPRSTRSGRPAAPSAPRRPVAPLAPRLAAGIPLATAFAAACRARASRRRRFRRSAASRRGRPQKSARKCRPAASTALPPRASASSASASLRLGQPDCEAVVAQRAGKAGEPPPRRRRRCAPPTARSRWRDIGCSLTPPCPVAARSPRASPARGPPASSAGRSASPAPPPAPARRSCTSSPTSVAAQSSVSAMPGTLRRSSLRIAATILAICCASAASIPGSRAQEDARLAVDFGEVEIVVEAAAAERVGQLARAVRGQHDAWDRDGLDRAELGNRDLEVGEELEQERLELLVGAVDLVDQEHWRRRPPDRRQQRPLEQILSGEDVLLDRVRRSHRRLRAP